MLHFYDENDIQLARMLPSSSFLADPVRSIPSDCVQTYWVHKPDDRFQFLHESAIIEYKGILYASWYNCPRKELQGYTPICGKRSLDGGKTWSQLEILDEDPSGTIMFCPPVYGIQGGQLYMFMNEMVAPDHIHSLNLYILDETTGLFKLLWRRPIPFKLNTNVISLTNGKLLLPGRVGELDGFPNTPAVLISDSGRIDDTWRLVKIAPDGDLPDGKALVHPEISVMIEGNTLYMFNRNDQRRVPLVYASTDCGESWSPAHSHDIPYVSSKIYAGDLSDGSHFLIANTDRFDRSKLEVFFTAQCSIPFTKRLTLFDNEHSALPGVHRCHYPCAWESDGNLYVIATAEYPGNIRGACLFVIDLARI